MIETEQFEITRERPGGGKPLVVRGEAYHPDPAASTGRTVVICHGFKGFAHWAFFPFLARELAKAGMRAITFDISGSGVGPDRENFTQLEEFGTNTFTQELTDLDQVIAEARRRKWLENGFGLFGHSRGGGIAILHAAHDRKVKALVTWAAISSPFRWSDSDVAAWRQRGHTDIYNSRTGQNMRLTTAILDEVQSIGKTKLDISAAARRIGVPWLIVHGDADETVPPKEGELLKELSPRRSTLLKVEGANHTFGASHPVTEAPPTLGLVTRGTVEFFAEHLRRATA